MRPAVLTLLLLKDDRGSPCPSLQRKEREGCSVGSVRGSFRALEKVSSLVVLISTPDSLSPIPVPSLTHVHSADSNTCVTSTSPNTGTQVRSLFHSVTSPVVSTTSPSPARLRTRPRATRTSGVLGGFNKPRHAFRTGFGWRATPLWIGRRRAMLSLVLEATRS